MESYDNYKNLSSQLCRILNKNLKMRCRTTKVEWLGLSTKLLIEFDPSRTGFNYLKGEASVGKLSISIPREPGRVTIKAWCVEGPTLKFCIKDPYTIIDHAEKIACCIKEAIKEFDETKLQYLAEQVARREKAQKESRVRADFISLMKQGLVNSTGCELSDADDLQWFVEDLYDRAKSLSSKKITHNSSCIS